MTSLRGEVIRAERNRPVREVEQRGEPINEPEFEFGTAVEDPVEFLALDAVLEDTGVGAYAGAGQSSKTRILCLPCSASTVLRRVTRHSCVFSVARSVSQRRSISLSRERKSRKLPVSSSSSNPQSSLRPWVVFV